MKISIITPTFNEIENIPLIQIFIYNNLSKFKFLFPHDKDYYALKIVFPIDEKRSFIDVGGNIGLSTIGFRQLGYLKNDILVFVDSKKAEVEKRLKKRVIFNRKLINKFKKIQFSCSFSF